MDVFISVKILVKLSVRASSFNKLIICSGKSVFYLSALVRQVGDIDFYLIGENGAHLQLGSIIPCKESYNTIDNIDIIKNIKLIEKTILDKYQNEVYLQPNLYTCTFFVYNKETIDKIKDLLNTIEFKEYNLFIDTKSIDIIPIGINKGTAVRFLQNKLCLNKDKCIGIGDNYNDIPMFEECSINFKISNKVKEYKTLYTYNNINQALKKLIRW